jgi:hypothetical protein
MLGQYFAAIHPDKVGKFIIDGVHDAESYAMGSSVGTGLQDLNAVVNAFYQFCSQAGPENCAVSESSLPSNVVMLHCW